MDTSEKKYETATVEISETQHVGPDNGIGGKAFGLRSSILFLVGSIIGTGIFMSPNKVVESFPSIFYSLLVWFLCGAFSLGAGLCYAELGMLIPSCGGEYTYFLKAYNNFVGFSFMFSNFLFIKPMSIAILVLFTADTLISMVVLPVPFWPSRLTSIVIVIVLFFIHCSSHKVSALLNDILTYLKFVAMLIIFGIAAYKLCKGETENMKDWGFTMAFSMKGISNSVYNCMWSYDGFNQLAYLVEVMVNPQKIILVASIFGLGLVIACYLLLNVSYLTVLSINEMINATSVVESFARPYMKKGTSVLLILVGLSALGSASATAYSGAMIYFDASRNHHIPRIISASHRTRNTLIPSLFVQAFITSTFLLLAPDIDNLLIYFSGASWVFYSLAILSVLILRHKIPTHRAFKLPYILVVLLALLSMSFVVLGFYDSWLASLISVSVIIASFPIYFIFVHEKGPFVKSKCACWDRLTEKILSVFNLRICETQIQT